MDSDGFEHITQPLGDMGQEVEGGITSSQAGNEKDAVDEEIDGKEEDKKGQEGESTAVQSDGAKTTPQDRPIWTRMHCRHLSIEVLKEQNIDYVRDDRDPGYVLIKRWVPEYEQDFLWAATRALRTRRDAVHREAEFQPQSRVLFERASSPQIVEVRRASAAELKLDINRIDMEEWTSVKYRKQRGKHVLDAAMEEGKAARLAINSEPLRDELRIIVGAGVGLEVSQERRVLIGPWKVLVEYEGVIRQRLQKLEEIMRLRDDKPVEKQVEEDDGKSHPVDEVPSKDRRVPARPQPIPCEVCDIVFPPHETPLECLDTRVAHLKCLVQFLDCDLEHVFELRQQIKDASLREIAFADLWHLFSPGDLILTSPLHRAYRVFQTTGGRPRLSKAHFFEKKKAVSPFNINCFYIGHDWKQVGPIHETLRIFEYAGKKPVTELLVALDGKLMIEKVTVCPLKMLSIDDQRNRISYLVSRGKKLRSLRQGDYKYYSGRAGEESLSSSDYDDSRFPGRVPICQTRSTFESSMERECIDSYIIIDNELNAENKAIGLIDAIEFDSRETAEGCIHYGVSNNVCINERFPRDCRCSDIVMDHVVDNDRATKYKDDLHLLQPGDVDDRLGDDFLMLLPPLIEGFVLETKTWKMLSVDAIVDSKEGDMKKQTGFKNLVLAEENEDLLKALVKAHASSKASSSEKNRDSSLTILLHGPKSTGKLLTVKALATHFNRPLYTITSSDFGVSTWEVGRELATHFQRAKKWNCIVAMPHAESKFPRRTTPPDGNYSASGVLLREIQLFHGIVILTTDSPEDVEEPVLKGANVCLGTKFWKKEENIQIWHKALRGHEIYTSTRQDLCQRAVFTEYGYNAWLEFIHGEYRRGKRWNGAEIDNYFDISIAMAEDDTDLSIGSRAPRIKPSHLSIAGMVAGASVFSVV